MKTKKILGLKVSIFSILMLTMFIGCKNKQITYNSENDEFIEAISPTNIERLSKIAISFVNEIKCIPEEALSFSPEQKGSWQIENGKTAIFTPQKPFKANSKIILTADCEKLFGKESAKGKYTHPFLVSSPSYKVNIEEFVLNSDSKNYSLSGKITTDIPVSLQEAKKLLKAKIGINKLKINWSQEKNSSLWNFSINDIKNLSKKQNLSVSWKGTSLGLSKRQDKVFSGKKYYSIPPRSEFSIIDVNTSLPNKILVSFSQELDPSQDIKSYIKAKTQEGKTDSNFNASVRNNVLTIFNDSNWQNVSTVAVAKGVKSSSGASLARTRNISISENWELPSVDFLTSGNILPTSQGTTIPIQTKNLCGLTIQAFRIHSFNMIQFFQENELNKSYELYRVGEPVWTKSVSFDWNDSMQNRNVPRGIDISELVKKYPDGMFQIRISFRRNNIKYVCHENHEDFSEYSMPKDLIESINVPGERSYWDWADNLSYRQRETYWTYKKDPCHPAFYMSNFNKNNLITRNILVSDLGVMAKKTEDNRLYVSVSNLKTTKPVSGAEVTVFNYVGAKLKTANTNSEGSVVFENADKVFVVAAKNSSQCSYLKISNGTELNTSHFDIGGEKASNGIKGFIYGERGVWRPGDKIFLTFVLQDLEKKLPKNIPLTFELIDPLGKKTESKLLTKSENGFFPIEAKTEDSSITGLWTAKVSFGGKEWTKPVRIETVVPNRLSVELKTDEKELNSNENTFTLYGKWLHGAATPNYKADVSVSFSNTQTSFDGYSGYTFTSPTAFVDTRKETVWNGYLDQDSKTTFSTELYAGSGIPGKLKAKFTSRLFEPSGAFSTAVTTFTYSPYEKYVGIKLPKGDATRNMLLTDTKHTAQVAFVDSNGNPIKNDKLNYEIYKIDWKWWWEKDAYSAATYVNERNYEKIDSGTVDIVNGKGSFDFEVKYPSWGRYLVTVSDQTYNGHEAGQIVYIDWPGWAGRAQQENGGSSTMIPLSTDKKRYSTGETAIVSFASSAGQRALISVEKGGNIIEQRWIETTDKNTTVKLPLKENMAPNVYVHLTLVQPHLQTANSLPIRLYGIVPIYVENPKTILEPVITSAETFEPNANTVVSVSEKNGNPMTYTLAVVDEGLLGLTGFHAPNLHSEFYKKEASLLKSWDLYSYVMNAYSGKLETLLAIGGSEEIVDNSNKNSNRFAPVVKFFGPYTIAAGEKKATSFQMPEYIGAVRIMVVAGNNGSYGTKEKSVPVKADLMIQPTLPRTMGTNESIFVPLTVFNGTQKDSKVQVTMNVQGAISAKDSTFVNVPAGQNATLTFKVETSKVGNADFTFFCSNENAKSRAAVSVPVQSRGIPVTFTQPFEVKRGKSTTESISSAGDISSTKLSMEISTMPSINLAARLDYLIGYPHGCIEQITSGAFPQLYLPKFLNLNKAKLAKVKANVQSVFERYPRYQTTSGGMGYWPGSSTPSDWGSCYAAHFLLEAQKQGYSIPLQVYEPLINWIKETATEDDETSVAQAYKLFVLALAGEADIGAMNRMMSNNLKNEQTILLSAAYSLTGRKQTAQRLLKQTNSVPKFFRKTGNNFESSIRITAQSLIANNLAENFSVASKLATTVAENLSNDSWLSTQEAAWSLISLLPFYESSDSNPAAYRLEYNGYVMENSITGISEIQELQAGNESLQNVVITNKSNKTLYGTLISSGMSTPGTEKLWNNGIKMYASYYSEYNAIRPENLSLGDTFSIKVKVINVSGKDLQNIALTIPLATGWEVNNDRIGNETDEKSSPYSYQDIRDDEICTYFDLKNSDSIVLSFDATVAYNGNYYIPAIHAEAMYDNEISAVIPGSYVSKKQ